MATIPDAEQWPDTLKRERGLSWVPDFGNERSPPGLDGTSQFRNTNGGGLWRCTFSDVQLRRPSHVTAWMAQEIRLQGGRVPIDVPLLHCLYQPKGIISDDSDIKAIDGGWAAHATTGVIELVDSTFPEAGNHFSFYDATYGWRLYRISTIEQAGLGFTDLQLRITFWPPARTAVGDDDALEFAEPRCVMRLASSNSMDLELTLRKRGDPNAEFVEAY